VTSSAHRHLLLVPTIHRKSKPPAPKGTRGLSPRCHPNSGPRLRQESAPSQSGTGTGPDTLGLITLPRRQSLLVTRPQVGLQPASCWPLSVCGSQVHSTSAPVSAHTLPDSLNLAGSVLVLFAAFTILPAIDDSRTATCGGSFASNHNMRLVVCQ